MQGFIAAGIAARVPASSSQAEHRTA